MGPKEKTKIKSTESDLGSECHEPSHERRSCCHRCGNVRKGVIVCKNCPQVFCTPCAAKMELEYGKECFKKSCPVCESICCCANKSLNCKKQYHCYKKCPTARAQRGLRTKYREDEDVKPVSKSSSSEDTNKLRIQIPTSKTLDPIEQGLWAFHESSGTPSGINGVTRFSPYAVRNSTIQKSIFALENEVNQKRKRSVELVTPRTKYIRGADSPLAQTIESMNPTQLRAHMDKAIDTFGSDFPDISWFLNTPLSGYPLRSLSDFDDPFLINSAYNSKHVLLNEFGENAMDHDHDDHSDTEDAISKPLTQQELRKLNEEAGKAKNNDSIPLKFNKRPKSILKPSEILDDLGSPIGELVQGKNKIPRLTTHFSSTNNFSSPKNDKELNYLIKQYNVVPSGSLPSFSPFTNKLEAYSPSQLDAMDVDERVERQQFYPELFDHA